jgi:hypothetical protein
VNWSEEQVESAWRRGRVLAQADASVWRQDACGAWMRRGHFGREDSEFGSKIENIDPTPGAVRKAMVSGLTARLMGDGGIEPDQDDTLPAEIDELIRRYGADAVAEHFVRFE